MNKWKCCMKQFLKKILEKKLRKYSVKILEKYKPDIIGITGSVGKTSAKDAIYQVLRGHFSVRKAEKNYNNEIGLPLAVIGRESGESSPMRWREVFHTAKKLLATQQSYPKILILEMGADHPGDIEYLTSFIKPKIGIITAVGSAHAEFFGGKNGAAKEKRKLIESLPQEGYALLNGDDEKVLAICSKTKANIITFGLSENCDIRASEIRSGNGSVTHCGVSFKLLYEKSVVPVSMPYVLGDQFVGTALIAIAIGRLYGISLISILTSLKDFHTPKGRMNLLEGIKKSMIIDDTYNASPEAMRSALSTLGVFEAKRKVAALGDMLELGSISMEEHKSIGKHVRSCGIHILISVGERARDIARGAREAGMSKDYIFSFSNISDAGKFLQDKIEEGDLILIKGSQGMRMEKIVKEVMHEPSRSRELLVRQEKVRE